MVTERRMPRVLVESPLVNVYEVTCRAPRSGYGVVEYNKVAQLGLPRRGVFVLERHGEPVVIDTTTALLMGPDDEYRVAHPTDEGDEGTVLAIAPQLLEDAIGGIEG